MINDCDGCLLSKKDDKGIRCSIFTKEESILCSCKLCLLKMMCENSCDSFVFPESTDGIRDEK